MKFQAKPCIGDATETGVVKFFWPIKDVVETRVEYPVVMCGEKKDVKVEIPFNSDNKYQVSVHQEEDGYFLAMKGASERIIARCDKILINGQEQALDEAWKRELMNAIDDFADLGERVLGFAYSKLPGSTHGKD